jgi:1-acyl-sn-glycerol-3-phosphate acyltransferase
MSKLFAAIRSLLFMALFIPTIVIWAILLILASPFSYNTRWKVLNLWIQLMLLWLRITCGIRHEVTGLENLPAAENPAIIMAKHQSTWETLAFQAIFPPHVWVLKQELLNLPFFGWGLRIMDSIAIDRSAGRKAIVQMVKQGKERLDTGRWVVVFPEGTRTDPGAPARYKIGGAVLAAKSGYPVVPVAHNAGEHWPKHWLYKYPGVIRVSIGPLIQTEGKGAEDLMKEVEAWIEGEMGRISQVKPSGESIVEG